MFKNVMVLLANVIFLFYAVQTFAISPGAGQAQVRNSMQEMQQNKQRVQQQKKNQEMLQQQKSQSQQRTQKQNQ